ncbi:MAG: DUF881 domain-containing protein [Actinomycetota bacterium]|nr:DUF881 domain-containing protein [Actinomycetota bacterium]
MTHEHAGAPGAPPRRRGAWRIGTPLVVLLSGALFAISYDNSEGTDLRPGRYADLASLAQAERDQYDDLTAELAELNAEVEELTGSVDDQSVRRLERELDRISGPAGLEPVAGPGVTVTLSDAPEDVADKVLDQDEIDPNRLIVHQQDLQAVVNAMWQGGAEAMTLQGQRIVSTTGIKCEGNAVLIQGVPYPQPYVVEAIGSPAAIQTAIESDEDVSAYRNDADNPSIAVGWSLDTEDRIEAPAYDGLLDLSYAEPLR